MYSQPFFIPRYIGPSMLSRGALANTRNIGLFKNLGNITKAIKKINWSTIINNTSKTLGIVNQSIPLVKQVGPILTNVKSMMKIASIFKDETDIPKKVINNNRNNTNNISNNITSNNKINKEEKTFIPYDESPTFFINN